MFYLKKGKLLNIRGIGGLNCLGFIMFYDFLFFIKSIFWMKSIFILECFFCGFFGSFVFCLCVVFVGFLCVFGFGLFFIWGVWEGCFYFFLSIVGRILG